MKTIKELRPSDITCSPEDFLVAKEIINMNIGGNRFKIEERDVVVFTAGAQISAEVIKVLQIIKKAEEVTTELNLELDQEADATTKILNAMNNADDFLYQGMSRVVQSILQNEGPSGEKYTSEAISDDTLKASIDSLDLDNDVSSRLPRAGIDTVGRLLTIGTIKINPGKLNINNIGVSSTEKLKKALKKKFGITMPLAEGERIKISERLEAFK